MNRFRCHSGNSLDYCCSGNVIKIKIEAVSEQDYKLKCLSFRLVCVSRTFEQVSDVGLFLFNDALVLTRRKLHHAPFTPAHRSAHTFLASVALSSLTVREITHTRCESSRPDESLQQLRKLQEVFSLSHTHTVDVRHAFVLEGPCRSWVCATERGEDMDRFLSALRSAINSALTTDQ